MIKDVSEVDTSVPVKALHLFFFKLIFFTIFVQVQPFPYRLFAHNTPKLFLYRRPFLDQTLKCTASQCTGSTKTQ